MEKTARNKLGRGINALLPTSQDINNNYSSVLKETVAQHKDSIIHVPIMQLSPNPSQPRIHFDTEKLEALAKSVQSYGILEPLLISKNFKASAKTQYNIIAGERRYRAAKLAKLETVPAILLTLKEEEKVEIALIENLQRENLNPIETAISFRDIMKLRKITQDELAKKLSISRPVISNLIRLLSLSEKIQQSIRTEALSQSHARLLLSIEDAQERDTMFKKILEQKLSVRDLEAEIETMNADPPNTNKLKESDKKLESTKNIPTQTNKAMQEYEEKLIEFFGTKVNVKGNIDKGSIVIEYFNQEDLSRVLNILDITL